MSSAPFGGDAPGGPSDGRAAAPPALNLRPELISRIDVESVVTPATSDPVVPPYPVATAETRIAALRTPDRVAASTAIKLIPAPHALQGVRGSFTKKHIGAGTTAKPVRAR